MNPNMFSNGESVLLIGEGNFSFAVALEKLNLPITLTATCYESKLGNAQQLESSKIKNCEYLMQKGVRVLLGVDGTKLTEHPILGMEQFSKIIFNFPHVGGKMKIHLNRKLLRDFFQNVVPLLKLNGQVLMPLCKGQGGTGADISRRWEDTWQVVEMAAQADFVLCSIVPFRADLVPTYKSIGYRSRDLAFHIDKALVHVFTKVDSVKLTSTLEPGALVTCHGVITCPSIYALKYKRYQAIIDSEGSPLQHLHQLFRNVFDSQEIEIFLNYNSKVIILSDRQIPLHIRNQDGNFICSSENVTFQCDLRHSLLDVLDLVLPVWLEVNQGTVILPGLVFNELNNNFSSSPISNQILILGNCSHSLSLNYLKFLSTSCEKMSLSTQECLDDDSSLKMFRDSCLKVKLKQNIILHPDVDFVNERIGEIVSQDYLVELNNNGHCIIVNATLIIMDKLAEIVFDTQNWRELWVDGAHIKYIEEQMIFVRPSLYSRPYTFDVCFSYFHDFKESELHTVLWELGGDIITHVSPCFNEFNSTEGWKSRCYKITYQSFDKALYKNKVIDIHENIICKMLSEKLGVKIH